ncbi:SusC/RagA family TonB-linked outer membrane protein [Sphingobacterium psychroaquaticum]|uniref:TonB-linked outer membrane protein, SusC/RagA family n=1 Tax=Sphingobacterium psychroaquaticum TaxID=561061 RepID=A0A1X7K371_9SPHI|nr:TonB-dependent receptor [Sphingobacterium psychroaquaticum]SMG35030.1 TonB-linked outer membrane protein, SusC/RagA family [Sphingobacterium psychroaquaticum]
MKQKLLSFILLCTLFIGGAFAQNRQVSGKVTSAADGSPIGGVSIAVVGGTTATQTDESGRYELVVPSSGTLSFTYVGFISQRVATGSQSVVNVQLISDQETIETVVVQVPYGTVKKTAFTGSESTVTAKTFEKQQVASFTKALEGTVAGIQANNGGGAPGTSADIRIRGIGSVNANSSPLYVIDGVPYSGSNVSISTDDIETTTVLKDAAATALYGSRAANGVIMITTKKGRSNAPKLNFTARLGFLNRAIPEYDRVSIPQYYEGMWHATRNRLVSGDPSKITDAINQKASTDLIAGLRYNATDRANDAIVLKNGQFNPDAKILYADDWQDVLFKTPFRQDYNLNYSGGSDKSTHYVSLGYLNEPGYVKFSGYERFNARVNVDTKIKDWLSSGINLDGALAYQDNVHSQGGTQTTNPFYYTRMMGPIYPVWERDAQGQIKTDPLTGEQVLDWGVNSQMGARPYAGNSNLLGSLELDERTGKIGNVNFNTYLEARFLNDFTFRTTLGGNYYNRYATTFQNPQFGDAQNVRGRSTKIQNRQLSFTFNQVLTYDKTINEDHNINVMVGHENYRLERNFLSATRSGFPFPGNSELAPGATLEGATSYENYHRIEGYFSRVNYSYEDKYLLSGSFRRDGTSRFYPGKNGKGGNQWGNFYSVGAGWRISQEQFLKNVSWINELKLRASYGEQGNEGVVQTRTSNETDQESPTSTNIDNFYGWQSLYGYGWNNVNMPGAIISSLANEGLSWEKNKAVNVGVDFTLFNRRIDGTIEWYNRESSNLLFEVPLPMSTGITSIWKNVGTMYNRGIDVQIGYNAIRSTDFDWRVDLNISHYKNKITKLPAESRETGIISGTKKMMEGQDLYQFWLRDYAGVNPDNGDALWYKDEVDANGVVTGRTTTNNVNSATYYYHGSAIPDVVGGLTNAFRYKQFDFSVLLTYQLGGKFYDGNYASLMHQGSYGTHWHEDILNAWKQPGDITDVPRLQNGIASANAGNVASSRFLFDATYLNIKNITLGYNFDKAKISRIGLSGLRVFANVDNAAIFTKRKGMDPQRAFTGTADYTYPTMRNFTFGVTIGL